MAASFNLAMLSYYCQYYETSDKTSYPTFLRTRPPATFISKSVTSLLLEYNWRKVAFFHPGQEEMGSTNTMEDTMVADTIVKTLTEHGIEVRVLTGCCSYTQRVFRSSLDAAGE